MSQPRPQRILFISSNSIGDAVMSAGVLAHLVDTQPQAQFTIVCGPAAQDLFRAVPRLERLIVMRKKPRNGHWIDLWKTTVGTRWEWVVDIRNSAVSRLLRTRHLAHTSRPTGRHKIVDNASILGLDAAPPAPRIWCDAKAEADADAILAPAGSRPVIAMGPIANWPQKQWPIARFAELARLLSAAIGPLPGAVLLVIAAPHERDQVAPLLAALPAGQVIDSLGYDMLAAAACLRRSALFVGNDSGLMHLASAMGTRTLGLFGPGNDAVYAPWGPHTTWVRTPEPYTELLALHARQPAANLMESLSVERVFESATAFLAGTKKAA